MKKKRNRKDFIICIRTGQLWPLITADILSIDQILLQVNEYPPGVGLSPHIDTHSAFRGHIFSLSLAGPCIMEFRRYSDGEWASTTGSKVEHSDSSSNFIRKAIFLPPRSMLLLSGEGRYAWHHYIPHHKVISFHLWFVLTAFKQ